MRLIIQRVKSASVTIENAVFSSINSGLMVLVGIEDADDEKDSDWLVQKLINMRIFSDTEGKMNLSVKEINGEILIVSQFTLHASTQKGNRPSFIKAARPEKAIPLYENFIKKLNLELGKECKTGVFGADMKVELINDGPVTIFIDSKSKE
ncbi:MAG: D-tyrosyl-tRNA(Tyr) deacylase [Sphingobacteriaceae bacterium]|nr:D-tyrosyl-tRNA(Tyr) deacylase [Sphingobacteriaceae bacterium]